MVFIRSPELAQILNKNTAMEINEFLKAANEITKPMTWRFAMLS